MSEDVSDTNGPPSLLTDPRIRTTIAIALLIVGLVLRGVFMVATRGEGPTFKGDEFDRPVAE